MENNSGNNKKNDIFGVDNIPSLDFDINSDIPEFSSDLFAPKKSDSAGSNSAVSSFKPESAKTESFDISFSKKNSAADTFEVHNLDYDDIASGSDTDFSRKPFAAKKPGKFVVDFDDNAVLEGSVVNNKSNKEAVKPQKTRKIKRRKKRIGKLPRSTPFVFVALVAAFVAVFSWYGIGVLGDILALDREAGERVAIDIPEKATYSQVIDILHDADLVKFPYTCKIYYQVTNKILKHDIKNIDFESGEHHVDLDSGLEGWINNVKVQKVTADTTTVYFPEGWTAYQMFDKLSEFGVCSRDELISTFTKANFDSVYTKGIENSQERTFLLEGYLYPDTYEFYEKSDANTIIRKMLINFDEKWTDEYAARAEQLGYTRDEIIKIASIIQREAANSEQMPDISSVIHNRLKNTALFPTLGCDSTANYISNFVAENVTPGQADFYYNAYNTSANPGLPPGPISNCGDDAIHAALYPSDTNYYYFCHDKNGKIYLASTYDQFQQNLQQVARVKAGG